MVLEEAYVKQIEDVVLDEREKSVIYALRDATIAATKDVGGHKNVRTMDVWVAVFSKG